MNEKAMSTDEFYKKLSKEDKRAVVNVNAGPKKMDFIPTGSWVLNALIGDGTMTGKPGGYPRGCVVEIFGDESSGKTTLALSACHQVQKMGGLPIFVDFERSYHEIYAKSLGVDTDPKKFVLIQPEHFQHGAGLIQKSLIMKPMLVVVDSVSAMIPKEFLEGSVDEAGRIGLQAQLMSTSLSYLTKMLPDSNTCLLFTNQLRSVIKKSKWDTGPDEESSGGRALKFYSSVRVKLRKGQVEKVQSTSRITGKSEKEPVNVIIKATVAKNKIDKPYLTGPVYIRFGEGFDNILSIIELATNTGTIKKSGAFLQFDKDGKTIFKSQGRESLRALLKEDHQAYKLLRESLVFKEDKKIKEEMEKEPEDSELNKMLDNAAEHFKKKGEDEEKGGEA